MYEYNVYITSTVEIVPHVASNLKRYLFHSIHYHVMIVESLGFLDHLRWMGSFVRTYVSSLSLFSTTDAVRVHHTHRTLLLRYVLHPPTGRRNGPFRTSTTTTQPQQQRNGVPTTEHINNVCDPSTK